MDNPRLADLSESWLPEATIDQMQEAMEKGELTSKELVLMYLARISKYDKGDKGINSVLEVNPDAIHIAEALDAERKAKGTRSPLHGIPVLIKDNIDTKDKMHTSAGSLALKDHYAASDSFVAKRLREAGAVILGKTNMTEWANFVANGMPTGYSSRGGQALNPYGPGKFAVGGSSAGSGASIAANLAAVAVGTETSGSILNPSNQNSLVGIKPTVGLVSRSGIIPIAHSQDTAGPMTRTVKDAAHLLNVLAGTDSSDPATLGAPNAEDYTKYLDEQGLKGKKVGIARQVFFEYLSEDQKEIMELAIKKLEQLGAEVVDDITIPSAKRKWGYEVLTYEFKPDLNAYLSTVEPHIPVKTLRDVIQFNMEHAESALKYGQAVMLESEATSGTLTESAYLNAREQDIYWSTEQGIDHALKAYGLDAVVFPGYFGSAMPAKAGYPSITVPAGYTAEGEPFGLTFTGTAYTEALLIQLGFAFEQATKHRVPPVL